MENIPLALTYDDVLLVPQRSAVDSRKMVDLSTNLTNSLKIRFPILAINMDTVVGVDMAIAMSKFGGMSFYPRFSEPFVQASEVKRVLDAGELTIPAIGVKDDELARVKALVEIGIKIVTIDIAHGHLEKNIEWIKKLKQEFNELEIIAGVIATYEGARDLFDAGADAVRVGVGPGTICTTRQVTGSGVPQITAIMEASRAGKEFGRPVIADGGTKTVGCLVKALGAGANAVVTGNQLAGTVESPGDVIERDGKLYKSYNGSTSKTEKIKQFGKYSKDKEKSYVDYVEGLESLVPYKGSVIDVLNVMDKGLRSGLSYSGAFNIKEFHERAKFVRLTSASIKENGAHGVLV